MRRIRAQIIAACLAFAAAVQPNPVGAQEAVRLEDRAKIELTDTKGFLNLNGVWTVEMWVRPLGEKTGEVALMGDDCWKGMSAELSPAGAQGWTLRLNAVRNVNQRTLDLTMAGSSPGKRKPRWIRLVSQPLTMPEKPVWNHIAIVKQVGIITVFLNGDPLMAQSVAGLRFHPAPTNLFLGIRRHTVPTRSSNADYGALRITDRVRYTRKFKPQKVFQKDGRTVLLLDFNVGQGGVVPDTGGGGHHGLIDGGEWLDDA